MHLMCLMQCVIGPAKMDGVREKIWFEQQEVYLFQKRTLGTSKLRNQRKKII